MTDIPRLLSGRPVMAPLTEKQEKVLLWLITFSEEKGHFPVVRDISSYFGVTVSRAAALIAQLEKHGYVIRTAERSRNIQLTEVTKSWYDRKLEQAKEAQAELALDS